MTCENNIIGSKKISTKGMLLSVGVWMMMSYSTFCSSDQEHLINEKIEDNVGDKKNENLNNENQEFIEEEPEELEDIDINPKKIEYKDPNIENENEVPNPKEENPEKPINPEQIYLKKRVEKNKLGETGLPIEIENKLFEDNNLKECIKDIEENQEFKVEYAGCCCHKGNLLNAKITDKKKNFTMAVKDIMNDVLIYDDNKGPFRLKNGNNTMAQKTNIYIVLANTIKTINETNKKKKEEKEKLDEELNLESLDPHQKHDEQNLEFKEQNLENRDPNLKYNERENEQEEIEEEEKKEENGEGGEPQKENNEEEKNEGEEHEEEEEEEEE
jgi:hypothetical protein